jgi:hypothetical protein
VRKREIGATSGVFLSGLRTSRTPVEPDIGDKTCHWLLFMKPSNTKRLRAERKAGEMLQELERGHGPGRGKTNSSVENVLSPYSTVLTESAIAPTTAHRWQQVASLPDKAGQPTPGHCKYLQ